MITCQDIIGWRPETRGLGSRVVLFMTDQEFHFAGEGRVHLCVGVLGTHWVWHVYSYSGTCPHSGPGGLFRRSKQAPWGLLCACIVLIEWWYLYKLGCTVLIGMQFSTAVFSSCSLLVS